MPRATNSGINAVISVVLPLPLHPASPKTRTLFVLGAHLGIRHRSGNAAKPDDRICREQLHPLGAVA